MSAAAHSVMRGRMVEGDFTKDTITFEMEPGYYMASGEYLIAPAKDLTPPAAVPVEALEGLLDKAQFLVDGLDEEYVAWPTRVLMLRAELTELTQLIKERSNG